jgi:uncharacterized membrane protein
MTEDVNPPAADAAQDGGSGPTPAGGEERRIRLRPSLGSRLRAYFFAGVLVTAPMAITFWLAWQIISWIDRSVKPLIPAKYNPETYLPFSVPGIGLIVAFLFLTVVGAFAAGLIGRLFVRTSERILARMPVIRSVYGALKQIMETVLAQQSRAFRDVVLIEYPRRGIWAIGFITGTTEGEVQEITENTVVNVFLPTTPNPTSGFLLFVPKKDLTILSMSVEEGIKMVVSGGIVTPADRRPPEARKVTVRAGPEPGELAP